MSHDEECPRCRGTLDRSTAGYAELGLVCRPCHIELERASVAKQGKMHVDSPETELLGVIGAAALLTTGIGFRVWERYGGERVAPSTHPEFFIYLRRGQQTVGPFHVRALARMWSTGGISETDEYRYPGMLEWRPVTEFVPPGRH